MTKPEISLPPLPDWYERSIEALEKRYGSVSLSAHQTMELCERVDAAECRLAKATELLRSAYQGGCWICSGDCAAANPPVIDCPMRAIDAFLEQSK